MKLNLKAILLYCACFWYISTVWQISELFYFGGLKPSVRDTLIAAVMAGIMAAAIAKCRRRKK